MKGHVQSVEIAQARGSQAAGSVNYSATKTQKNKTTEEDKAFNGF